jgi:hypothetical protein
MNVIKKIFVSGLVIITFYINHVHAATSAIPNVMSFPHVLYDDGGNVLQDGDYAITLYLKDSSDATLYNEEQIVTVRNGVSNIILGDGYAVGSSYSAAAGGLTSDIFNIDSDIRVEIQVDGYNSLQEVSVLGSQPYAYISEFCLEIANDSISSAQITDGSITEEDLELGLLEELSSTVTLETTDAEGNVQTTALTAKNIAIDSDIGLNNASGSNVHEVLQGLDSTIDAILGINFDQSVSNFESDLSALESSTSSSIASLNTSIESLQGSVTTNTNAISSNSTTIGENSADIIAIENNITSLSSAVATNTSNISLNTTNISGLDNRVILLEADSLSESEMPPSVIPFAYGTANMNASGTAVDTCSGYNIDNSTTGSCTFSSGASDTSYVVVTSITDNYNCNTSGSTTTDWLRFYVSKTSGSAFNVRAECISGASYTNPSTVDFIVFYER